MAYLDVTRTTGGASSVKSNDLLISKQRATFYQNRAFLSAWCDACLYTSKRLATCEHISKKLRILEDLPYCISNLYYFIYQQNADESTWFIIESEQNE